MKFLLDHCVEASIKSYLERSGHEVVTVTDVLPSDSPDVMVATTAQQLEAVLISKDRDFNAMKRAANRTTRQVILETHLLIISDCSDIANRLSQVMDLVEFEWSACQLAARRLFVFIKPTSFWVER